jgi:hypothetical protein
MVVIAASSWSCVCRVPQGVAGESSARHFIGGKAGERRRRAEGGMTKDRRAGGSMVTARDAYDDWYEDDEPYGEAGERRYESSPSRPLELVRRTRLAFELIAPESFEEAQTIADRLRAGAPVLVDLRPCDPRLAGRLLDFCSGLVYAVEGTLQHVGREVLLLTPSHVVVSGDEASAVREPGFYNRS